MSSPHPVFVMSDIHGQLERFRRLLREYGLIDDGDSWAGGQAALWLLGDYVDRGPDGVGVIELIMRLEQEAAAAGGQVRALLGNHEVLLLGMYHFRGQGKAGDNWRRWWKGNGGQDDDLRRLRSRHVLWLTFLPALVQEGDWLLAHADSMFYTQYGQSHDAVNEAIKQVLLCDDPAEWTNLGNWFTGRMDFLDRYEDGATKLDEFFRLYGGGRLVHGHTPIGSLLEIPHEQVRSAHVYQNGRCVNVDGGLFVGGPGVVYTLPQSD